jgi:hypothetical protein
MLNGERPAISLIGRRRSPDVAGVSFLQLDLAKPPKHCLGRSAGLSAQIHWLADGCAESPITVKALAR